jgi:flagellar motor switch protein FliN/FliY
MTTAKPLPTPASATPPSLDLAGDGETAVEQALALSSHASVEGDKIKLTAPVARLPVELDVAVPVRNFRVRNLLALEPGKVIETQWAQGVDLPLLAGAVQLAWSEFEVVETELAVRVTRLA